MYNVLLVDDEYMILSGLQKIINWDDLGLQCVGTASNGQEALEFVRKHPVDIVVTDVSMPEQSGIEFVQAAQEEDINFNFVVLSGYQEFEYVKEGIRLGAENFLLKPISKEELNETLRKTVSKLDSEKRHAHTDTLLFENTLERWVNDDIDNVDLRRILKQVGKPLQAHALYTCMIITQIQESSQTAWIQRLISHNQYYAFYDDQDLVMILEGDRFAFDAIRKDLSGHIDHQKQILAVGELLVPLEEVPNSYQQAETLVSVSRFYGDHPITERMMLKNKLEQNESMYEISFKKFHHALSIGDIHLIKSEIGAMFKLLFEYEADPEYVRYIGFVIFSDIYRQHESVGSQMYHDLLHELNKCDSIAEIREVLHHALEATRNDQVLKQHNPNIQKVLQIVLKDYAQDITISSIADTLHMNAMYLGQLFKKETNKSFSQYLNHFRIKEAQNLLLKSNHNINEIAELVGYTSSGYFYKNFKKECGISPKEYRERYLKQPERIR